ncbi:MAG: short chain dehydrogenase, partial [Corynebacterium kroppenstedtii]|nr:short chain dehydrogenase [Corynebacterium kroppenstedtii]
MADSYAKFVNSGAGSLLASKLGLPKPEKLRRFEPGQPPVNGPIIVTGSGSLASYIRELLEPTYTIIDTRDDGSPATDGKIAGLVIDATGFTAPA